MLHFFIFNIVRVNDRWAVLSVGIYVTVWCNQLDTALGKHIDISAKLVRFPKSAVDSRLERWFG